MHYKWDFSSFGKESPGNKCDVRLPQCTLPRCQQISLWISVQRQLDRASAGIKSGWFCDLAICDYTYLLLLLPLLANRPIALKVCKLSCFETKINP